MRSKVYFVGMIVFIFLLAVSASPVGGVISIMPLGDSITKGSSSGADPDDDAHRIAYRAELWHMLDTAEYDVDFVGSLQAGGAIIPSFDPDHEGHGGGMADEIEDGIYNWLVANPADIILLHIGTNDIDESQDPALIAAEVSRILDEIDRYETDLSVDITVILALIINRWNYVCGSDSDTTDFNDNVDTMALDRINNSLNPAYPDKIETVDMECGADIDYRPQAVDGDMYGELHPFETGYEKMADVWFSSILAITLPVADAGSNQDVSEFDSVTLDGSNSSDPDGSIVLYE